MSKIIIDKVYYLQFDSNWYNEGDVIEGAFGIKFRVLETPHRKWWKRTLQYITLGFYKVPCQYKVKRIQ